MWGQWCTCVGARSENFPAMNGRLSTPQAPCPTTLQAPYNENGGGRTRKEKRKEGEVKMIWKVKIEVKIMYIQHIAAHHGYSQETLVRAKQYARDCVR